MDITVLLVIGLAALAGLIFIFRNRLREGYGTLRPSTAVTQSYERHDLDPNAVYYSGGPDACPHAVIAIDRTHRLVSDHWKERTFNPETFRDTIAGMQRNALATMQALHGLVIVDHRGQRIGTWFSILNAGTTIKVLGENRVGIDPPPLPGAAESP